MKVRSLIVSSIVILTLASAGYRVADSASASGGTVAAGYGWPVKPFGVQHPIRGYPGDPRTVFSSPPTTAGVLSGSGSVSFHQGVDISAPDGTAVYPVESGVVTVVTHEWIRVSSGGPRAFEYWHIRAAVRVNQKVTARGTVLGRIMRGAGHVHLTELESGRAVDPLQPGHLEPYSDHTRPVVGPISFRRTETGRDLFSSFVRGKVLMVANAYDTPALPVPGTWHGLPVSPARLSWRIQLWTGKVVVPEHVAADFRGVLPANPSFWSVYARGTYQNMSVFGKHYSYLEPGCYLFKLTPRPFDTSRLHDGVYDLVVTATDMRGNTGSSRLRFTIHNRPGLVGS